MIGVADKPLDTMKVVLPPERPKVKVKVEEKIDKSELHLMLFPGQIQKISNLITLLAHQRDLLQRYDHFVFLTKQYCGKWSFKVGTGQGRSLRSIYVQGGQIQKISNSYEELQPILQNLA